MRLLANVQQRPDMWLCADLMPTGLAVACASKALKKLLPKTCIQQAIA